MSTDAAASCCRLLLLALWLTVAGIGGAKAQATDETATVPAVTAGQVPAATTTRYSAMIELPKAYVSGVCLLSERADTLTGCLFNEFGISALEFVRYPGQKKVKILSIVKMLDKWYVKRVLSRDIASLLDGLQQGRTTYRNEHRKINYTFTLLTDHATEE